MLRRKLWVTCVVFGVLFLLVVNWKSSGVPFSSQAIKKSERTERVHQHGRDRKIAEFHSKLQKVEEKEKQWEAQEKEDLVEREDGMRPFRGDIQTAKVNIEVNGHSITFDDVPSRSTPEKIRIHLIFHSHVDPGWLKTFEEYYTDKVHSIISNAVESLRQHKDLRFIWSETSFLERWWRDATPEEKANITEQVKTGQLEISGGAWVMTDEATPTFYAAIENMIEGHQFIHEKFGLTPNTSWSVDPFGHGAMMPTLLHQAGVDGMVIGRFHEHIKQKLRQKQSLRWRWIPPYSEELEGPRVNSLPHMVYTTEDACPDHSVCACYHVGPSALWQQRCSDQSTLLHRINDQNVAKIVKRFVAEMRKVQGMYGETDLLVPIGDDFYFGHIDDWRQMHAGFAKMIDWLKNHPEENAEIRFSTVSDFFTSIKEEKLNTLRGDFFPYTSNMNNPSPWWSGYFVHRPYTKTMERRLQNQLRALDIVSMLKSKTPPSIQVLTAAKRQLTLYQHHDGITGTSRPHVMADYEKRMADAFKIFSEEFPKMAANGGAGRLVPQGWNNTLTLLNIPQEGSVHLSVFSSQTYSYAPLLKIKTDQMVRVETADGKEVPTQSRKMKSGHYHVEFVATLAPLAITSFTVKGIQEKPETQSPSKCWKLDERSRHIEGLILGDAVVPFNLSLVEIGDRGGAYVLDSFGEMRRVTPNVSHTDLGIVESLELSGFPSKGLILKITCLKEGDVSIEMNTDLSMGTTLAMSIRSGIKHHSFYTDVNEMFHLNRKFEKTFDGSAIPMEASIFPVASSVLVQDSNYRLTVVSGQPTGATAPEIGVLEVLVDRATSGDDGKGLGYGDCLDKRSSNPRYRILLEKRTKETASKQSFLSLAGERTVNEVLYPPIIVASEKPLTESLDAAPAKWPCSIQLVSWRHLTEQVSVLILRKYHVDETVEEPPCEHDSLSELFDYFNKKYKRIVHTKLSATEDGDQVSLESFQKSLSSPLSIAAFRLYV